MGISIGSCVVVARSCPTRCDPMDCSWPDSSVHRIFPEKTLEWIVILSSRGILLTQGSKLCLLPLLHCRLSHWERQPTMQSRKMDYCLYPLVCETKQYPCNNWPQMVRTWLITDSFNNFDPSFNLGSTRESQICIPNQLHSNSPVLVSCLQLFHANSLQSG